MFLVQGMFSYSMNENRTKSKTNSKQLETVRGSKVYDLLTQDFNNDLHLIKMSEKHIKTWKKPRAFKSVPRQRKFTSHELPLVA